MNAPLKEKLTAECDVVPWSALQRHFAFGRVHVLRGPQELVDLALIIHDDSADALKPLLETGQFGKVLDSEAQLWQESNAAFSVLVIDPFVLIKAAPLQSLPS